MPSHGMPSTAGCSFPTTAHFVMMAGVAAPTEAQAAGRAVADAVQVRARASAAAEQVAGATAACQQQAVAAARQQQATAAARAWWAGGPNSSACFGGPPVPASVPPAPVHWADLAPARPQPPAAHQALQSAAAERADFTSLTRGARRRLQQRLRKKMGKLERLRAAAATAGMPSQEPQPLRQGPLARPGVPAPSQELPGCPDIEVEELPILVIDKALNAETGTYPGLSALLDPVPRKAGGAPAQKIVPVCEIQQVVRLEDNPLLEIMDTFVPLPSLGKVRTQAAMVEPKVATPVEDVEIKAPVEPEAEEACEWPVARGSSKPRCLSWPTQPLAQILTAPQIPTVNTFVHFSVAHEQPCRRSLSV